MKQVIVTLEDGQKVYGSLLTTKREYGERCIFFFHDSDKREVPFGWTIDECVLSELTREERKSVESYAKDGNSYGWYTQDEETIYYYSDGHDYKTGTITEEKQPPTKVARYYYIFLGDIQVRCIYTNTPEAYEKALAKANEALKDLTESLDMMWKLVPIANKYKVELEVTASCLGEAEAMMEQVCKEGISLIKVTKN